MAAMLLLDLKFAVKQGSDDDLQSNIGLRHVCLWIIHETNWFILWFGRYISNISPLLLFLNDCSQGIEGGLTTTTSPCWCMNGNASMMSVFPKPVGRIAKTSDCIHHDITSICSFFNSLTPVWCDIFRITASTSLAAPAILPNRCATGYWSRFSL